MNSRIYPQDVFDKHYQDYLNGLGNLFIPVSPTTQAGILQIKITKNLEAITRLIDKITNKYCQ